MTKSAKTTLWAVRTSCWVRRVVYMLAVLCAVAHTSVESRVENPSCAIASAVDLKVSNTSESSQASQSGRVFQGRLNDAYREVPWC
jgi:hypothetical protein